MTHHFLVIEGDEAAVYVTCRLLKASGFSTPIEVVRDGFEALAYPTYEGKYADRETGDPSLILLDLKLPDLDGFELFKRIRSNPALSGVPIFILSASNAHEDVYRSALLGVSSYLTNPLDLQKFQDGAAKILDAAPPIQ